MKHIYIRFLTVIFICVQSNVFAQNENTAIDNADYNKLMFDVIKNDGPGIPPGRSRFDFNISHVHKSFNHWKTGA